MDCIICSATLVAEDHEGVHVEACASGCGLWLDQGELSDISHSEVVHRPFKEREAELEAADGATLITVMEAVAREGVRPCPVCAIGMAKVQYAEYSAIVIDSCSVHGAWLDSGELERVEAYAEGYRRRLYEDIARSRGVVTPTTEI